MSVDAMIAKCESFLGTVGRPNEATRWYAGRNGAYFERAPWCDMFITWAAYMSGNHDAVCLGKDYAYTVWHAQAFAERGQWHTDVAGIRRGDIVFFDWGGSNSIAHIDHVGIVTDVNGRDVLTIEGNSDDRCARRVRRSDTIAGYGRPVYATTPGAMTYTVKAGDTLTEIGEAVGVRWQDIAALNGIREPYAIDPGQVLRLPGRPPVTPTPPPAPTLPLAGRTAVFEEVRYGAPVSESVKVTQTALDLEFDDVVVDGKFGPQTKAAYAAWQRKLGYTGSDADGTPGITSFTKLAEKYGFTVKRGGVSPTPPPSDDAEPAHVYTKTTYGGKRVNQRTKAMLQMAAEIFGKPFVLTQGSYNTGVSASAGTHDGGGVVDISVSGMTAAQRDRAVQALRQAGLAAWLRVPPAFSYHIHAVAIGDREMSSAAKSQIRQWAVDTNGLANHGPDPAPDPYPAWTQKYR